MENARSEEMQMCFGANDGVTLVEVMVIVVVLGLTSALVYYASWP